MSVIWFIIMLFHIPISNKWVWACYFVLQFWLLIPYAVDKEISLTPSLFMGVCCFVTFGIGNLVQWIEGKFE